MKPASVRSTSRASYVTDELSRIGREEWDALLVGSPGGGHNLQSYDWGEFKRRIGWRPVRLALYRDGEAAGVGQFLLRHTLPVPGAIMYCTKGPWLPWDDEEAVRAFFEGVVAVAEREGAHTVKIEPEVPEERTDVKSLLSKIGFSKARYDLNDKTTMKMDLEPPEEELLARMKSKTRYNIRLAARKGVEVVEPEDFGEAWDSFYELSKITAARHGYPIRRSREYLRDAATRIHRANRARVFFAEHEGEQLAAMLVYTLGNKYWYSGGASKDEKRNLMPTYLLQWEVMRWARSHGLTHYDMVGVPRPENLEEGNPYWGIYRFKSGFGGEIADFLGCMDLAVKPLQASIWHKLEPLYYRAYYKVTGGIFY